MKSLLIAAVAVLAFLFMHPQTSSAKATQTDVPFNITLTNTCCGEDVAITGNLHIVIIKDDGNTFQIHENTSGLTGTGTSGDTYHGNITASEKINNSDGSITLEEHFTMTSSTGCKFKLTASIHIVFDANGNMTVDNETFTTECF